MSYLAVFLGGGLGSILRYALGRVAIAQGRELLWGTLLANFFACLLLGYLAFSVARQSDTQHFRLLLATGFCGGFSTFSTFSLEAFTLLQEGRPWFAFAYVLGSLLVGLAAIFAWWHFTR